MTFTNSEPNEHYRVCRLVSGGGRWEIGISLYATGARLRMGMAGRPPSVLDFCLGRDAEYYAPIFCAVVHLLEPLEETVTAAEIDAVFPWAGTRPDLAVHLQPLLDGAKMTARPSDCRSTLTESQTPKARVTKALSQRLVGRKIQFP